MYKILLVEDDLSIVETLTAFLRGEGFAVDSAYGQAQAEEMLAEGTYDLLLLDISLADGNGFAVCALAKERHGLPVIFLSASGDEYSVVTGLDMGADDYISKPFRPRELISRIRNVLRRSGRAQAILELGPVKLDTVRGIATKNGEELYLSTLEYRLLLAFLNNKGRVLTRAKLLEDIWDVAGEFVGDNTLTVYIKRLRAKIEDDPADPKLILTVRGLGYRTGE